MKITTQNSLGFALTTTLNTLRKHFNNSLKEFNISSEQYTVMKLLEEYKKLTPSEIAKFLRRDKANITRIVNALLKKDLIEKESVNKKSYKIKLTNKGYDILKQAEDIALEYNEKIKKLVGEDTYNFLIEKLTIIREGF